MDEDIPLLCFAGEPILPDRDSYSIPVAFDNVVTNLTGGPARSRANYRNGAVTINVTYTLNYNQCVYFSDLYYGPLLEGSMPIRLRLALTPADIADNAEYVCTIVSAPQFPRFPGTINTLTITVNAVPLRDRCLSEARQLLFEAWGGYLEILETVTEPMSHL